MLYTYRAKIIGVYDGDTVTALVQLGFNVTIELKLRLYGIDTPEVRGKNKKEGIKVRDYVRELILNKDVVITTFKDKKGKYGRYLAEVWLDRIEDDALSGILLNRLLIDNGMAKEYFGGKR